MWVLIAMISGAVFVACGGGSRAAAKPKPVEDVNMRATDFRNINTMTKVDNHFMTNVLGHDARHSPSRAPSTAASTRSGH